MTEPRINLVIDQHDHVFRPHETLRGHFSVAGADVDELRAVEVSVLWHTEGKGDEDMSVHSFERVDATSEEPLDLRHPRPFQAVLPNSPLSYEGAILKIRWCVRVRVFVERGKELCAEESFQLGSVPVVEEVAS